MRYAIGNYGYGNKNMQLGTSTVVILKSGTSVLNLNVTLVQIDSQ